MHHKRSKLAEKAFRELEKRGFDDAKHKDYLEHECRELDLLCAWQEIEDAKNLGKISSTNPSNLMVSWLFGISEIDPLLPRTFFPDDDGIEERCFVIVFTDDREAHVHFRSVLRLKDGTECPADKLRPGMEIPGRISMIFPGKAKFREVQSDEETCVFKNSTNRNHWLVPIASTEHLYDDTGEYPDIDVDFAPSVADRVVDKLKEIYGSAKVIGVATYQRLGNKSTIKDISRVWKVPYAEVNALTQALPDLSKEKWDDAVEKYEELKKYAEKYPRAASIMKRLLGRIKGLSTHASALIISSVEISNRIPLVRSPGGGELVSSWAEGLKRQDLSIFGFVKFDKLLLQTLDDMRMCIDLAAKRGKIDMEKGLFRIPGQRDWSDLSYLDDKRVLRAAAKGETIGCFQFDSQGIRALLKSIHIDSFEELIAANALYRPGVLQAEVEGEKGGQNAYIKRKHGITRWDIPDKLSSELCYTYGLLVFQEQVMKVLEIVGKIPLPECDAIRKAISKKKMAVLNRCRENFAKNAEQTVGWSYEEALAFFDNNIVTWSGYGFNRSHSVGYAIIAARTLWLKVNFPAEFFCAFMSGLSKNKDTYDRLKSYAADASRFNIEIKSADVNKSKAEFTITKTKSGREFIRFGLSYVKSVGKVCGKIVAGQPYKSMADFLSRASAHKSVVTQLIHAGAFDSIEKNRRALVEYFEAWRSNSKTGVKKTDYLHFLASIGFPSARTKHADLYLEFQTALLEPDEEEERFTARTCVPWSEFRNWAQTRWSNEMNEELLTQALADMCSKFKDPDMPTHLKDFSQEEKTRNSEEAYGTLLPFEHPMRKAILPDGPRYYIKDLEKETWMDQTVDGYVDKVDTCKTKKSGATYYKIHLSDGYDSVQICAWEAAWFLESIREEFIFDENGQLIEFFDPQGRQQYKTKDISVLTNEVIQRSRCVRLKCKWNGHWFVLSKENLNAQPIELKWQAEEVQEKENSNQSSNGKSH